MNKDNFVDVCVEKAEALVRTNRIGALRLLVQDMNQYDLSGGDKKDKENRRWREYYRAKVMEYDGEAENG